MTLLRGGGCCSDGAAMVQVEKENAELQAQLAVVEEEAKREVWCLCSMVN